MVTCCAAIDLREYVMSETTFGIRYITLYSHKRC